MPYWIAMDIDLDNCHSDIVLGIFTNRKDAEAVVDDHEQRFHSRYDEDGQPCYWMRKFEVFEVAELDKPDRIDYDSDDPWQDRITFTWPKE